jgi:large subunit ribosomal protein L13
MVGARRPTRSIVFTAAASRRERTPVPTYSPKRSEIERTWWVVDAEGLVLGRLATEVANRLRGKHKPTYTPHLDTGDHVIIVNADKVVLTSDKAEKKMVHRHSGYPGGIRSQTFADLLAKKPEEAVRRTVRGMVPKNRLGRQQLTKLKVYAGPTHPHAAQKPQDLELDHAKAKA